MTKITDVAERAGVSITTVSRVLSGSSQVAVSTRERVEAAIHELNYIPNALARGMITKSTSTLALILPDITNPFFPGLARGVQDVAREMAYTVMLSNSEGSAEEERTQIEVFLSKQVDGIIIASVGITAEEVYELASQNVPVVLAGRGPRVIHRDGHNHSAIYDWVRIENYQGAFEATSHLIEEGHHKIAMISGPHEILTSQERVDGYREALRAAGIELNDNLIENSTYQFEGGYETAQHLLSRAEFTAVFAANDLMAVGALQALKDLGYHVPQDISVVGFDDIPIASMVFPSLTTVGVSSYEMGKQAAKLLLERIRNDREEGKEVTISPHLIKRNSVSSL